MGQGKDQLQAGRWIWKPSTMLFQRVKQAKPQRHARLRSLRESAAMSCLGSEARRGAEMAARKDPQGQWRREAGSVWGEGVGFHLPCHLRPAAAGEGLPGFAGFAQLSHGAAVVLSEVRSI